MRRFRKISIFILSVHFLYQTIGKYIEIRIILFLGICKGIIQLRTDVFYTRKNSS